MKFFLPALYHLSLLLLLHQCFQLVVATIETTCRAAAVRNPTFDYNFCVDDLKKDYRSPKAGTLELAEIAAEQALLRAQRPYLHILGILRNVTCPTDPATTPVLQLCLKQISGVIGKSLYARDAMKAGQLREARERLIGALNAVDECENAFMQMGKQSLVTEDNKKNKNALDECLLK